MKEPDAWVDGEQLEVLNANLDRILAGDFDQLIADFAQSGGAPVDRRE